MSTENKFREYQLAWDEAEGWSVGSLNNSECYNNMHVIEIAAVEQLKAELDDLKQQNSEYKGLHEEAKRMRSEITALRQEIKRLKNEK